MIYYRYLFRNMEGLSPNEGLVYSALLSHSLMSVPECFDIDGKFDMGNAEAIIDENMSEWGFEGIDYSPVSTRRLSGLLNMKEDTIRKIKNDLVHKHRLIMGNYIMCPSELLDSGYIDISPDTKLKGRQLTFYGLLRDRSSMFHGVIDTWASRLAELAGITKTGAHKLIHELQVKGYIERLADGKLRIK